jgi:hypothetical protein
MQLPRIKRLAIQQSGRPQSTSDGGRPGSPQFVPHWR